MSNEVDGRLREALVELDRYLADQVAPLLVADSVEVLLDYPPAVSAEALHLWVHEQFRFRSDAESLSELTFHALKKIQMFEEFALLPGDRFAAFLAGLAERLIELAPEAERQSLADRLVYLRQGRSATVPTVEHLHRAPKSTTSAAPPAGGPAAGSLTAEEVKALRRFSLLLDRLPEKASASGTESADSEQLARRLLVLAAAEASSAPELDRRLARLQSAGVGPAVSRDLVRSLSAAIPDWVLRHGSRVEIVHGESVEAVRNVVKLAGDKARTTERWKDLLRTAAESFNQGAFARAVTLLDLADRMVAEGEVDTHVADLARGAAHTPFEPTRLLAAAADESHRPILRRLVEFFPDWSVRELLDDLVYQPDPKKRRLLLALLEVWGAEAYAPVVERLATAVAEGSRDPNAWWYHRNLVFLLHRLPRPDDVDTKQILDLAGPFSALGHHPSFQRETFLLLAQLPASVGGPLLVQRLGEAERAVADADSPHDPREMEKILNSLAAALARSGFPPARRALLEHALGQRGRATETSHRLRELGSVDLSTDRESLSRLLEAARFLRPKKVLGIVVSRNEEMLADVARALAGTTEPAARRMLSELAEQFPDREIGRVAAVAAAATVSEVQAEASARETEDVPEEEFVVTPAPVVEIRPRASLAGDLEVFGLPGLLQNLQQSEASGRLVLRLATGTERASLELGQGRLVECSCEGLEGEAAFYQIFERPASGTFEFSREPGASASTKARGTELMALLMEAMRRFDEYQRLRAMVPDEATLRPGSERPSTPERESDGELVRRLWTRLRDGASVAELEAVAEVDGYRTRLLLAHWLEEGAAEIDLPGAAAAV